ncbi:hypothetical protein B6U81_02045 [Thermoplasmatales archaeon ex4484_30]|nr:MAG: hypothetical protein B6U81_02045 [Thermoplasmatales archaeon ex4484_30]
MGLKRKAEEIANIIEKQEKVIIVSHSDADGIAGASIAKKALEERGIDYEIKFVKYINRKFLKKYRERENFTWFIDVGNGNIKEIKELQINCVISDHHFSNEEYDKSLNPFFYGIDGIVLSSIIKKLIEKGFGYNYISSLFGEVYEIDGKDVRDYSTLLNAMARCGYSRMAVDVCIKWEYKKAENILKEYRNKLNKYINFAKEKIDEYGHVQYFHGGNYIADTVVGTVAGMIVKDGEVHSPVIAFAENEEGIKVSARAPSFLIEKGINLSKAVSKSAKLLGGEGGGHRSAAGAIIPKGMEEDFLYIFNEEIRNQLTL